MVLFGQEGLGGGDVARVVHIDDFVDAVGSELECDHTVVATGGSMVLSPAAMEHLRSIGTVVFIDVPFGEICRRVKNIRTRGIVFHPNETLEDVYRNRLPLYYRGH